MERRELVDLKLAMEFGIAPIGNTLPEPATNDEGQPRLLVSQFGDQYATYFRHDLPNGVRVQLQGLDPDVLMRDEARVTSILEHDAPVSKVYRIRWYTIQRMPEPTEYPDVTFVDGQYVVLVDGTVAAWARTDRDAAHAAEVEIATEAAFRRRGYARQVTAAWAAHVLAAGKVAFYSHLSANAQSQAVASSLGLIHLSDEVEYL